MASATTSRINPKVLLRSLEFSAITLLILIAYITFRLITVLSEGGVTTILQFEGGQLIGTDLILGSMLLYIYVNFLGDQR